MVNGHERRFVLIWGVCLWGGISSIFILTLLAHDGARLPGPTVGIVALLFLVGGYLWATAMWWFFCLTKSVARAFLSRRQRRRSK